MSEQESITDLQRIVKLSNILKAQIETHNQLKDELAAAKEAMLRTEREDLPTLMLEIGITEITLDSGEKVKIAEDCSTAITEATRDRALTWLLDNNFGGLIKTKVSLEFARGEREEAQKVVDSLKEQYEGIQLDENVHPSTLRAFVKERLREGQPVPFDLFNVFPFSKAILK